MRRYAIMILVCASLAAIWPRDSLGQSASPEAEVFGGVTKIWGRANGSRFDEGGGEVSVTGYFNRVIGLEANFNTFGSEIPNAPAYGTHFSLLFGPHLAYHGNRWVNPFAHALIGLTRGGAAAPYFHTVHHSAFTFALGGGVDVKVWRFVWIRPIQLDFMREYFPMVPYPPAPFPRSLENNLRFSAGLTLHLGRLRSGGEK